MASILYIAVFGLSSLCGIALAFGKPEWSSADREGAISLDRPIDGLSRDGFNHLYNLEYDAAIRDFEIDLQAHPDDPFAVNHLLQALFGRELYREGGLNAELYFGDDFFYTRRTPVDPRSEARIKELVGRALELAALRLKIDPLDVDALYARGVTHAIHAAYLGLVEKAWLSALRSGQSAYKDHQQVLRLSPNYSDAKLVVGFYSYAIGSLPWFERTAAFLLAFTGNKSIGSEYVRQAASGGGEASAEAKVILALILAREHHPIEAMSLMRELYDSYPHNFLFAMAAADLLRNSGQLQEAVVAYQNLLSSGREGLFPGARLELAAYKLGETFRLLKNYSSAAAAYELVSGFPHADSEILCKATLRQGEMYDLLGQRGLAVSKYKEALMTQGDFAEIKTAREFLKHPYRD